MGKRYSFWERKEESPFLPMLSTSPQLMPPSRLTWPSFWLETLLWVWFTFWLFFQFIQPACCMLPLCLLHFSPLPVTWILGIAFVYRDEKKEEGDRGGQKDKRGEWKGGPPPGDLPNPGIEPRPPALQADSLPSEPSGKVEVLLILITLDFSYTLPPWEHNFQPLRFRH